MSDDLSRKKSTFVEDLGSLIPGYSGYRKLESRREDDRNTRKYIASRLGNCKTLLDGISKSAVDRGDLDTPSQLEKYRHSLDLAKNRLAAAVEGYAGWFSERKVDAELLDRVGDLDKNLITLVNQIDGLLQKGAADRNSLDRAELTELLDALQARIDRRRELLQGEVG